MLVSAIASYMAIGAQHRAGLAMMSANDTAINCVRGVKAGETNFNALHQQDVKNSTANAKAQFMYQAASAWKKHSENKLKDETLNYLA